MLKKRSAKAGFMVISFVIAMSLAMFGTLRSLAIMSAEQSALRFEIEGRAMADTVALDCIYANARALMIHGSIRSLESVRVPVMDGFCSVEDLDEVSVYGANGHDMAGHDAVGTNIWGVHASFAADAEVVRAEAYGSGSGTSGIGMSMDGPARVFHSRIHAEVRVVDGMVDLIRI